MGGLVRSRGVGDGYKGQGVRLQLISFLFAIVAHASQINDLFASQCRYVRQ